MSGRSSRAPVRFANAVLTAAAAVAGAVLAFVIWRREWLLTGGVRTAFFLGLPLLGGTGFLLALRLRPPVRVAAAIAVVFAGAGIYAAELYLTFGPASSAGAIVGGEFDARTKYQVVTDYRKQGIKAYPAVFPAYLLRTGLDGRLRSPVSVDGVEVLPLGGVARAPTVLCNESGRYVVYESDEAGFNNPPGLWAVGEALAIAALGDSFVQGYCVPADRNFVALIRAAFPRTLNLGTSGAGPLIMLAALKEFLPARRPRHVLWFFFEGNDVPGDLAIERKSPLLQGYLEPGFQQRLESRRGRIDAGLAAHVDALIAVSPARRETDAGTWQNLVGVAGLAKVRAALGLPIASAVADYALFRRIVDEAARTVGAWGGSLVFVYLPAFASATGRRDAGSDGVHANVVAIANELGVPVIDLRAVFARHPDPASLFPFRRRGHYNEAGHALVARAVLESLPGK